MVRLKFMLANVMEYLGDAAHRRATVGAVLMIGNHLWHWTNDETTLATVDTLLAVLLAAWSRNTPKIDADKVAAE